CHPFGMSCLHVLSSMRFPVLFLQKYVIPTCYTTPIVHHLSIPQAANPSETLVLQWSAHIFARDSAALHSQTGFPMCYILLFSQCSFLVLHSPSHQARTAWSI